MATVVPARRRRADSFRTETQSFRIHEDVPSTEDTEMNESAPQEDDDVEEEGDPVDEDGQKSEYSDSSEEEGAEDDRVIEDMEKLQNCFAGFRQKYRLIKRIGEGLRVLSPFSV